MQIQVFIRDSINSRCSFLVGNDVNNSQYDTSILIRGAKEFTVCYKYNYGNNSRFQLYLSSPRSIRVPHTVAMTDEVVLESTVRCFFHVYRALSCSA